MPRTTSILAVAAALLLLAIGLTWQSWMATADPPARTRFAEDRPALPAPEPQPMSRDPFALDRPGQPRNIPFDGERAMKYLKELCDIGPRISGTPGMAQQQKRVIEHFQKHGATVTRQEFTVRQRSRRDDVRMTNLIAYWHPERKRRIILCSHYDTRPAADQEPDRLNWNKPFLSANDGTSGVALLMELAHHIADVPTPVGVDFVLFDGEEYIFDPGEPYLREGDRYFLGSEHFASEYLRTAGKRPFRYEAAILFDLFAHENARLAIEGYSYQFAPGLVNQVWKVAESVGAKSFRYERGFRRSIDVLDDHIALNRAGIPAIDIIDFDYVHWHRLSDTPEQCSAKQFAEVARVVTTWLQRLP
jgi:glutaminyl-peptide cyclotransferase